MVGMQDVRSLYKEQFNTRAGQQLSEETLRDSAECRRITASVAPAPMASVELEAWQVRYDKNIVQLM